MKKFAFLFCVSLLLAACQQTTGTKPQPLAPGEFEEPVQPGQTRLSMSNFDRDKWTSRVADTANTSRTIFVCRALACAYPSVVVYSRGYSPTRNPDPTALLNQAKANVQRSVAEGETNISPPVVGKTRGFPSYSYVMRGNKDGKVLYRAFTTVVAGGLGFGLNSISEDEATARKNLAYFLSVVEIKDGGPQRAAR